MRIIPFSNGTEFMDYLDNNCSQCARSKYGRHSPKKRSGCSHLYEIELASITDGTIPMRNYNVLFANKTVPNCKRYTIGEL